MPRITILPEDGAVYKDKEAYIDLDLSSCGIPDDIHALQWFEVDGWIEFEDTRENEVISALPAWADCCLVKWQEAYDEAHKPEPEPTGE